jgi:hypothetical protein
VFQAHRRTSLEDHVTVDSLPGCGAAPVRGLASRRIALAVAIPLVAFAVGFGVVISHQSARVAYANGKAIVNGIVVPGGGGFCQADEYVPGDAGELIVWVSTAHRAGSPLDVSVRDARGAVTGGHAAGGYIDSPVTIPLARPHREAFNATVCVVNAGPKQAAFMGDAPGANDKAVGRGFVRQHHEPNIAGHAAIGSGVLPGPPVVVRLEWHRARSESWLGFAPVLARRAALAKPGFVGSWTFWLAGAVVLLVVAAAIATAAREALRVQVE